MQALSPEILQQENLLLKEENAALKSKLSSQEFRLNELLRLIYGSKSEKFISSGTSDAVRLSLFAEQAVAHTPAAQVEVQAHTKAKAKKNRQGGGRMALPENLEREVIEIAPEEDTSGLQKIGEEVTEQLDYLPGKLYVRRYVRAKYALRAEDGSGDTRVLIGALPKFPIEKGIPASGLLAQICVDKVVDHLPVYRQIKRYARLGMTLRATTINGWLEGVDQLLQPLGEALKRELLGSRYLQADESPIKVLDDSKKGQTHQGYMWLYRDPGRRLVYFDYRPGRDATGPTAFLDTYQGYLQTDGYTVYEKLQTRNKADVRQLHCMAHARRYFEKALNYDPARAEYFIRQLQKLYVVEKRIREQGLSGKQVTELRTKESEPVLKDLGGWLKDQYVQVLDNSPIGKAIGYSLQRWERLSLYITEPYLQIDNNGIENAVRPLAVGRKNYLFAGSHRGAERMALLYSLMACCKSHDVNPYDYLRDVLDRIGGYPQRQVAALLPHHWKAQLPTTDPAAG